VNAEGLMPNAERSAFALRHVGLRHSALIETGMKLTNVIRRPLLTEKTANLKEERQTVVFEVAAGATKVDIKRAVEQLLGAKVANVRTALVHGKIKRQGRFAGRRPDWKKAYVRLRDGEKMPEFLEGA
jgi:large subunit ribosomal protein L23